jgi:Tetratricopeptide repeat
MTFQWGTGDQSPLIANPTDSPITITYEGQTREVPLEPAVVSLGRSLSSPAQLIRARSGVVPYLDRAGIADRLTTWTIGDESFRCCVIGGRAGSGKTRLGAELCVRTKATWLAGLLAFDADPASLEVLVSARKNRLVVIDYAESRVAQLNHLLPLMKRRATHEHRVRVLLLVRRAPRNGTDWIGTLRHQGNALDEVLNDAELHILDDMPFEGSARQELFKAAARAFASQGNLRIPETPATVDKPAFSSPLLLVIAAYLAVHSDREIPRTRVELLNELLAHEDHYWQARASGLDIDEVLRRRVVALATLAGAATEDEGARLLCLLRDLSDATAERRHRLARWAHDLYPGPRWWNPIEPDLLGEYLVADCFSDSPSVLDGVLDRTEPKAVFQPLDLYARAAPDYPRLRSALGPLITERLGLLCDWAIDHAASETDRDVLLGEGTIASALNRVVTVVDVDRGGLVDVIERFPGRSDLILNPLAVTLTLQLVSYLRGLADTDTFASKPELANSLSNLSVRLADVGQYSEALVAIEEAVELSRQLARVDPAAYEPGLANSLNNLSLRLAEIGRQPEASVAIEEAVERYRGLAGVNPAAYEAGLANSLNNHSNRLVEVGGHSEALAAIEKAAELYRRLAGVNPAAYEPRLASSLNNLSLRLAKVGRHSEALAAIEEVVHVRRRVAGLNPAAYEPDLAISLNNLSLHLAGVGRHSEALAASEEAVERYRRLAGLNPAAYEPGLADSLNNLSLWLAKFGRDSEALAAIEEVVHVRRRLARDNPAACEPDLAGSLINLSVHLAPVRRYPEALAAIEEATERYRQLAAVNPAAHEPNLATSLNDLSVRLAGVGRYREALAASEEAVTLGRRLAGANPEVHRADLAMSLNVLSVRLVEAGRRPDALAAIKEAVGLYRRLAGDNPDAHEPNLAMSLNNLSVQLGEIERYAEGLAAVEEAVRLRRRLAGANPAIYRCDLAMSLNTLSAHLVKAGRPEEARSIGREAQDLRKSGCD